MNPIKLKVCGITNQADLEKIVQLGFHYVGFIFYPHSPRYVSLSKVKSIIQQVNFNQNPHPTLKVGVFVDASQSFISQAIDEIGLDVLQLHGNEDNQFIQKFKKKIKEIWKVFPIKNEKTIFSINQFNTPFFLLDKYHQQLKGGTGKSIDYSLIAPWLNLDKKIILAGGLNLTKVKFFFKKYEQGKIKKLPYAFDFNSQMENRLGIKSFSKLKKLIKFFKTH